MPMLWRKCETHGHYQNPHGCPLCPHPDGAHGACADCGSTGHDTGSNACEGPEPDACQSESTKLDDPNAKLV